MEEKKQADENIALKNVSQNKSFFENTSPKLTFILGLVVGIVIFSLIGIYLFFTNAQNNQTSAKKNLVENKNFVPNIKPPTTPPPSEKPQQIKTATFEITKNNHIKGNLNAPITLVVFSDFQCSYCARFEDTLTKTLENYKDKVQIVFKHYPLSFHKNAQKAAEAAECASEQEKFWEMHDKLFVNQAQFSIDNFRKWAKELNLDSKKFNSCLDSEKYSEKVKNDLAEGQLKGVEGTPATFVNGKLVSGALPFEDFKPIIDADIENK